MESERGSPDVSKLSWRTSVSYLRGVKLLGPASFPPAVLPLEYASDRPSSYPRTRPRAIPSLIPSSRPSSLAICESFSSFNFLAVLLARAAASSASCLCASTASSSSWALRISLCAFSSWSLYSPSSSLARDASCKAATRASFTCLNLSTASLALVSAVSARRVSLLRRSERIWTIERNSWVSCSSWTRSRTSSLEELA